MAVFIFMTFPYAVFEIWRYDSYTFSWEKSFIQGLGSGWENDAMFCFALSWRSKSKDT